MTLHEHLSFEISCLPEFLVFVNNIESCRKTPPLSPHQGKKMYTSMYISGRKRKARYCSAGGVQRTDTTQISWWSLVQTLRQAVLGRELCA